jgi:hypothetical protein
LECVAAEAEWHLSAARRRASSAADFLAAELKALLSFDLELTARDHTAMDRRLRNRLVHKRCVAARWAARGGLHSGKKPYVAESAGGRGD